MTAMTNLGSVFYLRRRDRAPPPRPPPQIPGEQLDLERLEARRPIKTFVTSVLKGEGYPDAFRWLGTHL